MKKRMISILMMVGTLSIALPANAEEASTDLSVQAEGGGISISSNNSISFPTIQNKKGVVAYHPTVNQSQGIIDLFTDTPTEYFYSHWMKNPYDDISFTPPAPLENRYYDARPYLIRVQDNSLDHSAWSIKVRRTPFTHTETDAEMKHINLFFGKFKDNGDVVGSNYLLTDALTVSENNSFVASYSGESAKGEHFISPFTPPNENPDGKSVSDKDLAEGEIYVYEDKNITLGTDKATIIPESGTYQSTLIWTLESAPE